MTAAPASERAVQQAVAALYRGVGAVVASTSQPRASRVTAGLPDLIVLLPRGRGVVFHEVKAAGGRQRAAQAEFQTACRMADVPYVLGGVAEARAVLVDIGLLSIKQWWL